MSTDNQNNTSETDREISRSVSPYRAGFKCTCPNCGDVPVYNGLLELKDTCEGCGFDLSSADAGDGAQIFVIMILGAVCALLGIYLHSAVGLPMWAIIIVLFVVIIFGTIWMLRVIKATLVALKFHHDAHEGRINEETD